MARYNFNRRRLLKSSLAWAGAAVILPGERAHGFMAANDRPKIGAVATGSRWYIRATGIDGPHGSAPVMRKYGDYVAVSDVDSARCSKASEIIKEWTGTAADISQDYRALIDRDDLDIIHISTPEHWHANVAIEAMKSGKDVYCEKPMTLTIEEGQQISKVCRETGRIMQVGTQQRSGHDFVKAIALIQEGRIGEVQRATCHVGGAPSSPSLPIAEPPKTLDWNRWQGPVETKDYRSLAGDHGETKCWSRGHYEFRWWYEYSGGKLTDWGAHHVDIATWGLDKIGTGPIKVDPILVEHPVEFKDGFPTDLTKYNTATKFQILATFADGKEIEIRHDGRNGILFEGTKGRLFVNRGQVSGKPVEELESHPLPGGAMERAYKGRTLTNHFENLIVAINDGKDPISDVYSHHRALSTCHLAAIAARLGRAIKWDPTSETVVDDAQAQGLVSRQKRSGFEIEM